MQEMLNWVFEIFEIKFYFNVYKKAICILKNHLLWVIINKPFLMVLWHQKLLPNTLKQSLRIYTILKIISIDWPSNILLWVERIRETMKNSWIILRYIHKRSLINSRVLTSLAIKWITFQCAREYTISRVKPAFKLRLFYTVVRLRISKKSISYNIGST